MTTTASSSLHQRVSRALDAAGDLNGPALIRHIEKVHADDPELIAEVRALLGESPTVPVLDAGGTAAAHELARRLHDRLMTSEFFTTGGTPVSRDERGAQRPLPDHVGPYRIVGIIGQGGMGVVYEAIQPSPQRRVAIKMLSSTTPGRAALSRFRQEAEVLGRLKHPGIAQVFEAAADPATGAAFFAMEYVQGPALTVFAREARLPASARVELLARVCDAVQHAHQTGVIHRDLKPSNILVETSPDGIGQPKVLDFGVAKLTSPDASATLSLDAGRIIGTLGYMPPEALDSAMDASHAHADTRGDVYSLGVLLYELLTDRLPIEVRGTSLTEAARRIREQDPPRVDPLPPGPGSELRADLDAIARKALEKEPGARYASAAELAADLRRCLRHEPVLARPPSSFYVIRKFVRRRRGLSALSGAATVLLLAAGVVTAVQYVRAERALVAESRQRSIAEKKQVEAERGQYRVSLAAADGALRTGDAVRARRVLEEAPEHLRGWEWRYLWRSANPGRPVDLGEPVGSVTMIGSTPLALSDSTANPLRTLVWNVDEERVERVLDLARCIPSVDGKLVLGVDADGMAVAADPLTGSVLWRISPSPGVRWQVHRPLMMAPAGGERSPHTVIVGDRELAMVDVRTGQILWRMPIETGIRGLDVILSRDASHPVVLTVFVERGPFQAEVVVLDGRNAGPISVDLAGLRYERPYLERGSGIEWGLRLSSVDVADSRRAAPDALWSGGIVAEDQTVLAVGDTRGAVHVYPVEPGERPRVGEPMTILAGDAAVRSLAFTPGNDRVIVVDATGRTNIVSLREPRRPWVISSADYARRGPLSPDRTRVLTFAWGSVECYDVTLGIPLWRKNTGPTHTSALAWSQDSSRVAWFGGGGTTSEFFVFDARDGRQLVAISDSPVTLDPARPRGPAPWVSTVVRACFDPRGDRIIMASADGGLRALSTTDWSLLDAPRVAPDARSATMPLRLREMLLSPDGSTLLHATEWSSTAGPAAAGSRVVVRDVRTLEPVATLETSDTVLSAAWFPGGKRIALGHPRGRVSVWKLDRAGPNTPGTLERRWEANLGTSDDITSVCVSPDSARVVASGLAPALHVIEAGDPDSDEPGRLGGQHLATIAMPAAAVVLAGFADPDTLITGGEQSAMIRLDARDAKPVTDGSPQRASWPEAALRAWPAEVPRPESLDEARWLVERADAILRRVSLARLPTDGLVQRALESTGEPEGAPQLAATFIRRLGAQLNWTNSAAVELLRDRRNDREAMVAAAAILEEIVAMKPHSYNLRGNLANALSSAGRSSEAIEQMLECERIAKERGAAIDTSFHLRAARIYREAGMPDKASHRLDVAEAELRAGGADASTRGPLLEQIGEERRLLLRGQ